MKVESEQRTQSRSRVQMAENKKKKQTHPWLLEQLQGSNLTAKDDIRIRPSLLNKRTQHLAKSFRLSLGVAAAARFVGVGDVRRARRLHLRYDGRSGDGRRFTCKMTGRRQS